MIIKKNKTTINYDINDIGSIIQYLNLSSCVGIKKCTQDVINNNPTMINNLLENFTLIRKLRLTTFIEHVPGNFYTKSNIVSIIMTHGTNYIDMIDIPETLLDDDYVEILMALVTGNIHEYETCGYEDSEHVELFKWIKRFGKLINANVLNKLLDKLIEFLDKNNYSEYKIMTFDWNKKYDWITTDIILKAVKIGQSILDMPDEYVTKEIVLEAYKIDYDVIIYVFHEEWFNDEKYMHDIISVSRNCLKHFHFSDEIINKLIILYPDTIAFVKNVDYNSCYKAYKQHGVMCVKYMPKKFHDLFNN